MVRSSAGGGATAAAAGGAALVVLVTVVVATAGWWACTLLCALLYDWRARGGANVAGVFRVMPCVTPPFRHPLYVSRSDT